MDFAVLVKVVPAVEQVRYDPIRKTLDRTGVPLYLNPFDARAVRVALALRKPREAVSVISMGPPGIVSFLQDTLALGADRALLLSDAALAGSDTLITARVLVRALGRVAHDLVLTGTRTTDSDTGQIGPEVAALLRIPVLSSVRTLSRLDGTDDLELVVDTETGWSRYRTRPPAVVTVGEKILRKVPPPTTEDKARAVGKVVERLDANDLGFAVDAVGLSASPTVVATVRNATPTRRPTVFADGSIEDRVRQAIETVAARLAEPAPVPSALPELAEPTTEEGEVLILVSGLDGQFDAGALALISAFRRLGRGLWPSVVWVGPEPERIDRQRAAEAGARKGYCVPVNNGPIGSGTVARGFLSALHHRPHAAAGGFLAHAFGREVGGQVAAAAGLGLTGDAVDVELDPDHGVTWQKPAFGGGLIAGIFSRTRPSLATVRPGTLSPGFDPGVPPLPVEILDTIPSTGDPVPEASGVERDARWGDLATARVVVSVGTGIGGPERLSAFETVLDRWGAALGATRRVVDLGWLPARYQIGLTGRAVAADLAVLVGVSGAANHLVGFRRTRMLLGVNADPAAPLFAGVDVGIVGRWEEVLPRLTEGLAPIARARGRDGG